MNWPDTLDLTLDGIAQGGEGVGRWEGRVVFAGGGLPGEHVRVRLRERHSAYARGDVIEVFEAAPERVPPRLPGADHIPWQHVAYDAQLRFKRQILADQLAKIGGLAGVQLGDTIPASRPWAYRSSARFHSDGQRVGYYNAGTRQIWEIEADPLLLPALNEALAGLRQSLREAPAAEAFEATLRASETHGYVVASLRGHGASPALAGRWRGRSAILAGVTLPAPPGHLGADHLIEELDGVAFRLSPATFFQVNVASAEALLNLVRAGLQPRGKRLLDLYCGAGAFTLPLARSASAVVGIEEHAGAVADAHASAGENQIANARIMTGRVEDVLPQIDEPFDACVLDPPRRGCHPRALQELLRLAPPRLAYIACHPATLARDLKTLVEGGYQVISVQPVDLFPQTPHIESVSVLVREGVTSHSPI